ncbi:Retrovirus-related Pol polyprotein from transposon [Dictyocoela muelleri]|nr:Retrovirus-related Pol polyprotein from transposon [Dictyocoela muelleri]
MEKFEYLLIGHEFTLITDHKSLIWINDKPDYGSYRINRWIDRLMRFKFKVIHRYSLENQQADVLSRLSNREVTFQISNFNENIEERTIMDIHINNGHRKTINNILKKKGIFKTSNELSRILKRCSICAENDKKRYKPQGFVTSKKPGGCLPWIC